VCVVCASVYVVCCVLCVLLACALCVVCCVCCVCCASVYVVCCVCCASVCVVCAYKIKETWHGNLTLFYFLIFRAGGTTTPIPVKVFLPALSHYLLQLSTTSLSAPALTYPPCIPSLVYPIICACSHLPYPSLTHKTVTPPPPLHSHLSKRLALRASQASGSWCGRPLALVTDSGALCLLQV
jgi:hypothetical protein